MQQGSGKGKGKLNTSKKGKNTSLGIKEKEQDEKGKKTTKRIRVRRAGHRVVRIVSYWDELSWSGLPNHYRVKVYSLRTGSWKELNVKVPACVWYSPSFETYFNGSFHWYAVDDNRNEVILSFHLGNEEFQVILIPSFLSMYDYSTCGSLLVWNGYIALVTYPGKGIEKSFEICVMEDYGVRESWTKILTIGPLKGVEMPLVFWKNDEIIMGGSDRQEVSYNLRNKELKDLPIYGVPKSFATLVYVNSLVSVKGGNQMLHGGDDTGESVSSLVIFIDT
ncbi:hypothetical protein DITRI_Ditri09bG0051000 [Diplodiscus trichospermus]